MGSDGGAVSADKRRSPKDCHEPFWWRIWLKCVLVEVEKWEWTVKTWEKHV